HSEKGLAFLSLDEASFLLKNREVSPVELVYAALEQVAKRQKQLNAFITLLAESALEEAKKAEEELLRGIQKSPLHGIPVALKDMFYTKGVLTTAGSKIYKDFVPVYDATVTKKLKKAGAIILGKTNTHDHALAPTNENSYFGPARNPWDPTKISGGSSGGSAIAVAAGMSYLAIGTDTGGSVRVPAALCGVVGLKPTYGRISLHGVLPLSFTLDHVGLFARSVKDAAIALKLIAGYDRKDPYSSRVKVPNYCELLEKGEELALQGVAIGVPTNYFWEKVDQESEELVRKGIAALEMLGGRIEEIEIPGLESLMQVSSAILFAEAAFSHRDNFKERRDWFSPDVRERLESGSRISAVEYIEALREREVIIASWKKVLQKVDLVAMATVPIPAYRIGEKVVTVRGQGEPAREMCVRHTRLANLTGAPALTVPCGFNSQGLPVGLQLMGRDFAETDLLRAGYAYEEANRARAYLN
ncbi:MAG: amidase, partial [Dethiobacteria bacterium]